MLLQLRKLLCRLGMHRYDKGVQVGYSIGFYDEETWMEYRCKCCGTIQQRSIPGLHHF